MKGIIFNLLEEMVEVDGGPAAWDELLRRGGVEGGYSSLGDYPDAELHRLLGGLTDQTDSSASSVVRRFGRSALLGLADRYPAFFAPHQTAREFLLTLNDVIHAEVRKLHPAAAPPTFEFDATQPGRLGIVYHSDRRLCLFAEGMITGAADHFGDEVDIAHRTCVHAGDDQCRLECAFRTRDDDATGLR